MRTAAISRKTAETDIVLTINLDGEGNADIDTDVGFLNHMLTLFARHARFDLSVHCKGDTEVDDHHSVEDIGIVLGEALSQALGNRQGIRRYGECLLPMDEALVMSAVDLSGRGACFQQLDLPAQKVGSFDTELVEEFFIAFARNGRLTLHLRSITGRNCHHIIEGAFKSCARSLRQAVSIDSSHPLEIPSTKGVL